MTSFCNGSALLSDAKLLVFVLDGGRPDVIARKALVEETRRIGAWWPCDKCHRLNKPRKQRCSGCQRWRGGSRPQMKKNQEVVQTPQQANLSAVPPMAGNQFPSQQQTPINLEHNNNKCV